MTHPILHHYPSSPYAEIVRVALGVKGLDWASVEQPVIMPRPQLTPLTGGYRRIPVLQIGADVYCDTGVILPELERRFPDPPLAPTGAAGVGWSLRIWAERAWFSASVAIIFAERGAATPEAFIKDREALSGRPFDIEALSRAAPFAADQWRANAGLIEQQLVGAGPFLLGERPTAADLAAWLNIWFLRTASATAFARLTAGMGALAAWVDRMAALGHGRPSPMDPQAAFAAAAAAEPAPAPPSQPGEWRDFAPGRRVTVAADDYGRDPITGVITHISPQRISLAREVEGAGAVVVHFPRAGFMVAPA